MLAVSSATEHYRGVLCRHCGKAVRVPGIVLRKDTECRGNHDAADSHFHLVSKVFVLRCRFCEREGIYTMSQILDCTGSHSAAQGSREPAVI